jgi:CBS domain containing-hemolysin-like protein
VTLEDLVEILIGLEIVDETDSVAEPQELARDKAKASALAPTAATGR